MWRLRPLENTARCGVSFTSVGTNVGYAEEPEGLQAEQEEMRPGGGGGRWHRDCRPWDS